MLTWSIFAECTLLGAIGGTALAAGFAITAQGAAASGKSSAFTAQADDPSALYFNPAGISQLTDTRFVLGTSIIVPRSTYHADAGWRDAHQENQTFFLPQLYVSSPIGEQLTGGIGIFTPFGVATDWPKDWDGRFQVTYASVQATVVNPTLSWKPTRGLSIAAGLDLAYLLFELDRGINLSQVGESIGVGAIPGNPEGTVALKGSAMGMGFNTGLLVAPSSIWALGLSFRSRIHTEIKDGSADFTIPVPAFQPAFPDGRIRTEINLPPSLRAGILVRPLAGWNMELDATWTGWSTIDQLVVEFKEGLPVQRDSTDFSWHNSMAYSLGTEYRWSPWVVRGGYTFDLAPIPDRTLNPILADGNRQWLSTGVGYARAQWAVDLGYHFIVFDRQKANDFGAGYSSSGSPPAIPPIDARANGHFINRVSVINLNGSILF